MQITIHRGSREVGGNCIEVTAGQSRLILDVGQPLFDHDQEPINSFAMRRMSSEQLRASGILPKVSGLFEVDGPVPDAILLSHAHEDHTGLLKHTLDQIPVYASVGTSKMMLAGAKFAGQPSLSSNRYRELVSGTTVQIGKFAVTPYAVDHSIFGAQAFVIESDGKSILYSGDLRLHGRKPGMHRSLIEAVGNRWIDVLLMEGTHINHRDHRGPNEYELEDEIVDQIQSAPGLVLASFSPQHVDRLVGFFRAAKRTRRVFVADAYAAFVMYLIASEVPIPRPESDENVRVFFPKFFEESFRQKQLEKHFDLMSPARILMDEIRTNPSRYVMLFRPSMVESDFGGLLPEGSRCIYSSWTGYLNRQEWQTLQETLANANGDLVESHTSGHIFYADIVELVGKINAKTIIPIHTFDPQHFGRIVPNVRVMGDGEAYTVV